jgi:hypothetical protein
MTSNRSFLILFAGVLLVLVAAGVALTIVVHRAGVIVVEVTPTDGCRGDRVSLRVPGALVAGAALFVPESALREAQADLHRWGPVALQALHELEHAPDCELVRIDGPRERVRIAKQDRSLVFDVQDGGETVHLIIPLATAKAVLQRLAPA